MQKLLKTRLLCWCWVKFITAKILRSSKLSRIFLSPFTDKTFTGFDYVLYETGTALYILREASSVHPSYCFFWGEDGGGGGLMGSVYLICCFFCFICLRSLSCSQCCLCLWLSILDHRYLWTGPYMMHLIAPPPIFFFNIDFFFHVHNILQLSMYHWMTYIQ